MSLWGQDEEGENVKFVLPGFTAAPGGRPVDAQWMAATAGHEKLLTAFAGGALPDVLMMVRDWIAEFATIGMLAPAPRALLAGQFPGAGAAMSRGGEPWGVPWTVDAQAQYYRRDLLADAGHAGPPERLDPWRAMLRDVQRRGRVAHAVLMQLDWPEHLFTIAAQFGARLLRDGQAFGDFRAPAFRAALAFYKSIFDDGLAPLATGSERPDPGGELARGGVALYMAGSWTRFDLDRRQLMPRAHWAVARVPGLDGPGRSPIAGAVLGVSRSSRDPAGGWSLVRFLTGDAAQLRLFAVTGKLPGRPSAWRAGGLAADPVGAVFERTLADPAPSPDVPEWPRIRTEAQAIAERMVRGQLSVEAAAAAMDARADALLAKRRWLLDRGLLDRGLLDGGQLA